MDQLKYNQELNKCETLGQILDVIKKYYDVDSCKIGSITKAGIVIGLNKYISSLNCKPK